MANSKDYAKRFGSLFMAALFLIMTIAFTAIIFWQTRNESNQADQQAAFQEALNSANEQNNQPQGENMLQGTQLEGFTPITEPVTELQIIDVVEGTGEVVKEGATVTAHYTGAVAADGVIFQSSLDQGSPVPFGLDGVIQGWTEGVPGMKVGGTRRLVIPAEKAYGQNPPQGSGIPVGADLVFDIELVSVEQ